MACSQQSLTGKKKQTQLLNSIIENSKFREKICFSNSRCEMKYVLLEMDRILRPTGYAIIRESTYFLDSVAHIAKGMRWSCEKHNTENKADKDKILICQKKLWAGKQ